MLVVWCDHYGSGNCIQSVSVSGSRLSGNEVYAPFRISIDDYLVFMVLHIQNRRPNRRYLDKRSWASRTQYRSCRCCTLEVSFIFHYRSRSLCLCISFCIQPVCTVSHRLDSEWMVCFRLPPKHGVRGVPQPSRTSHPMIHRLDLVRYCLHSSDLKLRCGFLCFVRSVLIGHRMLLTNRQEDHLDHVFSFLAV